MKYSQSSVGERCNNNRTKAAFIFQFFEQVALLKTIAREKSGFNKANVFFYLEENGVSEIETTVNDSEKSAVC